MFGLKAIGFAFLLASSHFFLLSNAQEFRIAGGGVAKPGQYPSVVSIRRNGIHYCGGSIVNSKWVLTAAHCIFNQTLATIHVVVGSNSLDSGGVHHKIRSIVLHEMYRYETDVIADNDIGLLLLENHIEATPLTKGMRFPSKAVTPGTKAVLVGWGRESQAAPSPSPVLKQLRVKTISNAACSSLSPGRTVVYSNFCSVSATGEGGCYGDSGTPLIDATTGGQIGIYSWVVAPCATGVPDGYTKVWEYTDWIKLHVLSEINY